MLVIIKSQLTVKFTMYNHHRADISDSLSGQALDELVISAQLAQNSFQDVGCGEIQQGICHKRFYCARACARL